MALPLHVSVVIPALNESGWIGGALDSLTEQAQPWDVCVADGSSEDDTIEAAERHHLSIHLVSSARGRARQMNAGARATRGDILLFLHADTQLPPYALDAIRDALADSRVVGGCFRTGFHPNETDTQFGTVGRAAMRLWEARIWMRWYRLAFGDRALFVRRSVFEALGGFPDEPIFEDLEFVRALRHHGRLAFLDRRIVTSARRFNENGAIRQQLRNLVLWLAWNVGVSPKRLWRFYPNR